MPTQSNDPIIQQASATIAGALDLSPDAVNIGVGEKPRDDGLIGGSSEDSTHLKLTIRAGGIDLDQTDAEKNILAGFNKLPPMTAIAQTTKDDDLAAEMSTKLKAVVVGTDFNMKLLESPILNPKTMKDAYIGYHAIDYINADPAGIKFSLSVPSDKNTDPTDTTKDIDANIEKRLPAIQELLAKRAEKNITKNLKKAGKSEKEIASEIALVREKMATLKITVNNARGGDGIQLAIRSPEQAQYHEEHPNDRNPDNADELRATNPLYQLSTIVTEEEKRTNPDASPQLNKTLARAFLSGGDTAMDVFPLIAGRGDIRSAIAKEAERIIKEHPEKEAAFNEIVSSILLKDHSSYLIDGKHADVAPATPEFKKNADHPNQLEVWIELPRDKVKPTLEGLANMAPQAQAKTSATTTPSNVVAKPSVLENIMNQLSLSS